MSITKIIVTTVKPAGSVWYKDAEPVKNNLLNAWVRNYPGLISLTGKEVNPTTWETVYEFEDRAACDAFLTEHRAHLIRNERVAYSAANGFVVTSNITELP
jgi:hypothetical protein